MQVRLLGPVEVVARDGPRPVPGLRRKAILATLALHEGEPISTSRLLDAVWGDAVPVVNTLQSHLSYLRGVLGDKTAILACPPGYVLHLGGEGTDVRVAERLWGEGAQSADPARRVQRLTEALALWRGRALADVTGLAWLEEQAERLDALYEQIRRALLEARLTAGEHAQVVPDLEQMAAGHPFDEQICAHLMLALYRAGRQADALAAYHRIRRALDEELGIAPGQPLRDLETAMLRQDPALDEGTQAVVAPVMPQAELVSAPPPVPAQLPPAGPGFAGRAAELASLDAILPGPGPGYPRPAHPGPESRGAAGRGTVLISAVSGTAGVGKTALAVHWAHRVKAQFPDGQLYVNLRGFDPGGLPLDPAEAVRRFLDALGVAVARIPQGLAAQTALYRSLLARKRMLVVLDNARDAEQVRPLLPGSPGCLAIVTSRNQLPGLVVANGASPLNLDLLTAAEARELLARRLGRALTANDRQAADEIIERCARLPLPLAIAAARAATSPHLPLSAVAGELREASGVLDSFDHGDAATDVRAVLSWSYQALGADAARLFRLLGLFPGPDITAAAAASLAAIPLPQARRLLAELTRAHLLAEHSPGRYTFHDLLRAYAAELARAHDSDQRRDAAIRRLLGHYLHTAHRAATLMESSLVPVASVALVPAQPGGIDPGCTRGCT